jgi:hypothetical protein
VQYFFFKREDDKKNDVIICKHAICNAMHGKGLQHGIQSNDNIFGGSSKNHLRVRIEGLKVIP